MKLLIGNNENIDFDEPVKLDEADREAFISLLKEIYDSNIIEITLSNRYREERIGDKLFQKKWTDVEREILLKLGTTEEIADQLGRTWMSVDIKRGDFLPKFTSWANQQGYDIINGDIKAMIKEFMEIQEAKKEKGNAKRREYTEIKHKLEEILLDKKEPCMVFDKSFFGGECAKGFHGGCKTCDRAKRYIPSEEIAKKFTEACKKEFPNIVKKGEKS